GSLMERKSPKQWLLVWGGILVVFAAVALLLRAGADERTAGGVIPFSEGKEAVGVVKVEGAIMEADQFLKDLKELDENERVKAIVVRIDSPGGAVAPSQEMYEAVRRIRDKGAKPVVVSMGNLAASGGMYLAVAGQKIYAAPGTLTGSIGVIMQTPNLRGVYDKVGFDMTVIKSGKFKDVMSPSREMTAEERALVQDVVDHVHGQFIRAVAEGRHLDEAQVRTIADGRFFTGEQAKEYGLVDELGHLQDAIDEAARLAKIDGEPKVIYPKKPKRTLQEWLTEESASMVSRVMGVRFTPTLEFLP
ncbi:MAG: signal peptide peptidase SppA, partial [Candidatus Methylomirabilis sp.]|nr:signal peptide peptidase SppA [Deltaproteobacteria bacterium]